MQNHDALEVILLRWGESSTMGQTVTFLLPNNSGPHPFKGLKEGKTGQRFGMALAFINDDETTVDTSLHSKTVTATHTSDYQIGKKKKKPLTLANHIGILIHDERFQEFCLSHMGDFYEKNVMAYTTNEKLIDRYVKFYCAVESKRDIEQNKFALSQWKQLYREFERSKA